MSRPARERSHEEGREHTGVVEGTAMLLTVVIFIATYWFQSHETYSETTTRAMFLVGTLVLCGMVVYGALVRHYIQFVSHLIVAGACTIGLSQVTALLATLPAFQRLPLIGPEGWGYLVHHDDMLLYPGFILMLGGFYLSILHAARMRRQLIREANEKEEALRFSEESAAALARRVAFENLATGISTRFINLNYDEIDGEIDNSLGELGRFANVDRAYISFSIMEATEVAENFEWCGPGVSSFKNSMATVSMENFKWGIGVLSQGESIRAERLDDLPREGNFEKNWFQRQGIKSVLNVPIISNRKLQGYIGFDSVTREMSWSDEIEPLLRMIGEILLSARDRRCAEQQRQLLELQVHQARKLESLGVMAGGIAHDFNNLLTGIMGNAELAQLDAAPGSDSVRYLDGVVQSARRAAELCRQMLAYAGRGKFITQPVDLNELIYETAPLLRTSMSPGADLTLDLADHLPVVNGDASQFRQLLVNLVTNASESLEGKRGTIGLRTGHRRCVDAFLQSMYLAEPLAEGDYVFLEIRDSGSGMPPHVVDKIFEPFFTTRFAGRGLGLPAVLGIVRGHKGALRIESEVGSGTSIQIFLPTEITPKDNWFAAGAARGDWHGKGTVLLADDEELVLSVGSMMLRHVGLDVVTANDGDSAIERATEYAHALQCVVLDFEMPGTDIRATCARIRALLPDVPLVIASGHATDEVARNFEPSEIAAFLPKPFELSTLQSVLKEVLSSATESS